MSELLKQVRGIKEQDEKDHEISMARGELEAIADKATQLASALQGKSDDGNPLEAWVQSKITKAKDYINSVSDYLIYNPDMKQNEEVNEKTYGWTLVSKAKDLAKKFANNITKAVAEIEKLEKGLSKNPTVDAELRKYNEETSKELQKDKTDNYKDKNQKDLEEKFTVQITKKDGTTMELGRYNTAAEAQRYVDMYGKGAKVKKEEFELEEASLKDIFTANQEGQKADEIAKKLKMSVADVKKILGEEMGEVSEENLDEFTSDMIKRLKKSYSTMPQKLSTDQANALSRHLDRLDLTSLKQLAKEKIPFITTLARNKIYKKTGKFEQIEEQDGVEIAKIRADRDEKDKKEVASKEKEVESLKNQVAMLKTKLENEKNRAIKPEPNPETGEVPLTIGIANKLLKDKAEKEAKKKEDMKEEMRLYVESIAAVKNKAEKTGMPYSILKQVYDRGMAAWKGGHRPGATQVQWALARVNSFVTKSSGTWGGADKDLAKKVKG
jgi:CRISPR/Cas system CSM-associated protein Csm2 small subunit